MQNINTGYEQPAIIELNETYWEKRSTTTKTANANNAGTGAIASVTPNNEATPFPPLKPT